VLNIFGDYFINSATELTCVLHGSDLVRNKAFSILFLSAQTIVCSFEMLDSGFYYLEISNNGVQFERAIEQLQITDSI